MSRFIPVASIIGIICVAPLSASAQESHTCRFTAGPRAGETQYFPPGPGVTPAPVGAPCADGMGSTGYAVPDEPGSATPALSRTCRFTAGPRAGEDQYYAPSTGVTPIPVGSPCTDGRGSTGRAVADRSP